MDCIEVGAFQDADQIILSSFLQIQDGVHLKVGIEFSCFLSYFMNQM